MRYRADKESLAKSRALALQWAQDELERRVNFLLDYFGRFSEWPEADRLAWYRQHDTEGGLQDFLMLMASQGPWQAKEARSRLRDAAALYEKAGIVVSGQ
jgi:hypothetical protein